MSADNAYFVIHSAENGRHIYSVVHGMMSPFVECGTIYDPDYDYLKNLYKRGKKFTDMLNEPVKARAAALLYAHDCAREAEVLEYGVVEVELGDPDEDVHKWATEKEREQNEIRETIRSIEQRYKR